MNTSWSFRIISLIGILLIAILGSGMLMVLFGTLSGLEVTDEAQLFNYLGSGDNQVIVKLLIAINHILIFILAPLCYLWIFHRNNLHDFLGLNHFQPMLLPLFMVLLFSLFPLVSYLTYYINQIDFPDFFDKMDKDSMDALTKILKMDSIAALIINLIVVAIIPGIGEELLFRGIIQKEFSIIMKNPHVAIWLTAIVFSAFHFQVTGFVPKMMIGLVLGYAYHMSGSLWLSMILHAINNGFVTLSLYFYGSEIGQKDMPEENISPLVVLLFLGVGFICFKNICAITKKPAIADE